MLKDELGLRLRRILPYLKDNELEGLLICSTPWRGDHIRYVTNYHIMGACTYALLSASGELTLFITLPADLERAERESWASKVFPLTESQKELTAKIKRMGITKKLGVADLEFASAKAIERIQDSFPQMKLISSSNELTNIRAVKSDYEINMARRAARIADVGFMTFLENARPGIKQYELIAEVEYQVRHEGAEDNFMLVASGGVDTRGMTPPTDRELKSGDLILTEITPSYNGYWTQLCRSIVLGEVSKERRKSFDIFSLAFEEALKIAKPGVPVSELARVQNQVFREEGFGEYTTLKWTRSRGHGQGLLNNEPPLIWEDSKAVLQEGMIIVIHPNTYLPLAGYMVLGDPTLITLNGPEILTKTERKLFST